MSRVAAAIDAARAEGRGAFVGYLPLGFPDLRTSIEAAVTLAENGADVLELGPPYSDPVMDGTVIQEATQHALANGFRMRDLFTAVKAITDETNVPVVVMTSERTGLDRVFLAAPTSTDERLELIARASTGFVYTVSTMGITGERAELDAAARTLVARLRTHGVEHACVGIGISTHDQVAGVLEYADGAIVGTALVRALRDGGLEGLAETTRALTSGTSR